MSIMQVAEFTMFVEGLDHPECVSWGPDGYLYAGGVGGQIYRLTSEGKELTEIAKTGGVVLGICLDGARNVYACDPGNAAVMRVTPDGEVSEYSHGIPERRMVTPNYPVFDSLGNLYVSDSGTWRGNNGCSWVIRPGGATELIDTSLPEYPNGLALDPAGEYLYLAMSTVPGVARFPVAKGDITGPAETVVTLDHAVPDGLAFDRDGTLYIGCYSPDVIYRFRDGELETLAFDWERFILAGPTNLTFGGPGLQTLFVASLCRWHLAKGQLAVPGSPYHYPVLTGA
jgi:gluconolactonase